MEANFWLRCKIHVITHLVEVYLKSGYKYIYFTGICNVLECCVIILFGTSLCGQRPYPQYGGSGGCGDHIASYSYITINFGVNPPDNIESNAEGSAAGLCCQHFVDLKSRTGSAFFLSS